MIKSKPLRIMDYNSEEEVKNDVSKEEQEEIKYAFSKYALVSDKQSKPQGTISVDNLDPILRSLGVSLTEAEIFMILEEFDPQQAGIIDYKTFLLILQQNIQPMNEDDLRLCFAVFDKDGNGHIATQEIRHVTFHLGEKYTDEEIEDMLKEADNDGDGRISFEDFVYFMTKL